MIYRICTWTCTKTSPFWHEHRETVCWMTPTDVSNRALDDYMMPIVYACVFGVSAVHVRRGFPFFSLGTQGQIGASRGEEQGAWQRGREWLFSIFVCGCWSFRPSVPNGTWRTQPPSSDTCYTSGPARPHCALWPSSFKLATCVWHECVFTRVNTMTGRMKLGRS